MDSLSVSQRHCSSCLHAIRATIHSQLPLFLLLHTNTHTPIHFSPLPLHHSTTYTDTCLDAHHPLCRFLHRSCDFKWPLSPVKGLPRKSLFYFVKFLNSTCGRVKHFIADREQSRGGQPPATQGFLQSCDWRSSSCLPHPTLILTSHGFYIWHSLMILHWKENFLKAWKYLICNYYLCTAFKALSSLHVP